MNNSLMKGKGGTGKIPFCLINNPKSDIWSIFGVDGNCTLAGIQPIIDSIYQWVLKAKRRENLEIVRPDFLGGFIVTNTLGKFHFAMVGFGQCAVISKFHSG